MNNLRQINLGMRLYWDDHSDFPPGIKNAASAPFGYRTGYKELMKSYVGLSGISSPSENQAETHSLWLRFGSLGIISRL